MNISVKTKGMTLKGLRAELQEQFPDYRYHLFGRTLMVSKNLLEGCGVVIKSGNIAVHPLPASLGAMALTAALGALMILPGLIYLIILFLKSKPLVDEVGTHLASSYATPRKAR